MLGKTSTKINPFSTSRLIPSYSFLVRSTFLLLISISIWSCQSDNSDITSTKSSKSVQKSGFEEVPASHSGLHFENRLKDDPLSDKNVLSFQYYFNGAGVGIGDFNNDGLQDIFFAGNEVPNELYINKGNFQFEKLGTEAGINQNKVWAAGVSVIDINLDGFYDIYVSQQGPYDPSQRKNLFYINNGDLTFTESAEVMGLADVNYSTQAAFLDYDKDGDLDCYVMDESKYAYVLLQKVYEDLKEEKNMRAASGRLYENVGNLKFKDVTKEAGVLNYGYGLGLAVSDFNNDNWPDILVVNDYTVPDFLYINQKDGTFKEKVKDYTRQISYFGMGCDVADINNDGLVDIGVVDMAAEDHFRDKTLMAGMDTDLFKYYFYQLGYQHQYMFNSLQLNNGNNTFSNIAAMAGVLKSDWSWSAIFNDFNLDGHKDYYVTNGYRRYSRDNDFRIKIREIRDANNNSVPMSMREEVYRMMPEVKLKNKLYINDGNLHFNEEDSHFTHPNIETYSYGAATADFDNDGDMDIIINNVDQPALLLKNTAANQSGNNYIQISLNENNPAKKLGSKITITTKDGEQFQEYFFVRGYESTMQEILSFGLGEATTVDRIEIVWPDGNMQVATNVEVNQHLRIDYKPSGKKPKKEKSNKLIQEITSKEKGVDYKHLENNFDDFEKEILLPQKQSCFGPALATADVNGDGLEDMYVGGAKGQAGTLYLQQPDGQFTQSPRQPWQQEAQSEDVDAIFVDPDQNGSMDLIILSGGSGDFVGNEFWLSDRFYANNGKGEFFRIANVIEGMTTASYAIVAENIDDDPEKEIMILGAAVPGQYPKVEKTIIYDYQKNRYVDITDQLVPQLNDKKGLIRDVIWTDINGDGRKDLITAGEWQNIEVYTFEGSQYKRSSTSWGTTDKEGWWRSITAADLDNDGDMDLIAGNVGKNFKQKASADHPLYLFSNDFDGNGTLDCVLAKDYNNKIVPARGRECSSEQMPFISEKFKTYNDFASASVVDILGKEKMEEGISLKAVDFGSYLLWNEGGKFKYEKLPALAQISPINDCIAEDFNKDGLLDIMIVGNDYNTEYETPRLDAGNGLVLINENKKFNPLTVNESGFYCPGDAKKIREIKIGGQQHLLVAVNNSPLQFFKNSN